MKTILLVEDDRTLGDLLETELSKKYKVFLAPSKWEALNILKKEHVDLAILDLGLPDGNGFEIVQSFREGSLRPHFLFLTAQNEPEVRLQGFEAGAEDFIPKPFHLKEVLLRVEHIFSTHVMAPQIHLPQVSIHLQSQSLHWKDGSIEYPPIKDMLILKLLIERSPAAVSRDEIINLVWGESIDLSPRTIDNAILRLRQVLKDADEKWIRSVRGVGYQWIGEGGSN